MKRMICIVVLLAAIAILLIAATPAQADYTCWRLIDGRCLPPAGTPQPTRPPVFGTWPGLER